MNDLTQRYIDAKAKYHDALANNNEKQTVISEHEAEYNLILARLAELNNHCQGIEMKVQNGMFSMDEASAMKAELVNKTGQAEDLRTKLGLLHTDFKQFNDLLSGGVLARARREYDKAKVEWLIFHKNQLIKSPITDDSVGKLATLFCVLPPDHDLLELQTNDKQATICSAIGALIAKNMLSNNIIKQLPDNKEAMRQLEEYFLV